MTKRSRGKEILIDVIEATIGSLVLITVGVFLLSAMWLTGFFPWPSTMIDFLYMILLAFYVGIVCIMVELHHNRKRREEIVARQRRGLSE